VVSLSLGYRIKGFLVCGNGEYGEEEREITTELVRPLTEGTQKEEIKN